MKLERALTHTIKLVTANNTARENDVKLERALTQLSFLHFRFLILRENDVKLERALTPGYGVFQPYLRPP